MKNREIQELLRLLREIRTLLIDLKTVLVLK